MSLNAPKCLNGLSIPGCLGHGSGVGHGSGSNESDSRFPRYNFEPYLGCRTGGNTDDGTVDE